MKEHAEVVTGQEIMFEALRVAVGKSFDVGAFSKDRVTVKMWEEPGFRAMMMQLQTDMLARKLAADSYTGSKGVEVPATWWQHLKDDHAPAWFKKRWPVAKKTITVTLTVNFTRYATYPMADIVVPKHLGHVVIHDVVRPEYYN